jgi:hypothetical protein
VRAGRRPVPQVVPPAIGATAGSGSAGSGTNA